ncbi:hypothetical protein E3N88_31682 [Mikania micrantha]|uniref:Uncharacterized protein n=1 Tax=Mikania micrantha TaxID=192012 RepID=A0A5N6M727_9ASTR|nr:hypothetical protein E3N88_31682 [Mikania micrantha]
MLRLPSLRSKNRIASCCRREVGGDQRLSEGASIAVCEEPSEEVVGCRRRGLGLRGQEFRSDVAGDVVIGCRSSGTEENRM